MRIIPVVYFILLGLWHVQKCSGVYVGGTHDRMKMKLIHLDRELVLHAVRNVQRVDHLKSYYDNSIEYDIGHTLYRLRSNFARMIRLLTLSHNNLRIYNHNKHIQNLLEVQKLSMDVHNLVAIMIDWEADVGGRKTKRTRKTIDFNQYSTSSRATGYTKKNNLRMGLSRTVTVPRNVNNKSKKRENVKRAPSASIISGRDLVQYKRVEGVGFDTDFY